MNKQVAFILLLYFAFINLVWLGFCAFLIAYGWQVAVTTYLIGLVAEGVLLLTASVIEKFLSL